MTLKSTTVQNLLLIFLAVITLVLTTRSLYHIITTTAPDFSVFWNTSRTFVAGQNPYLTPKLFTGLGYPPNTLLFFIPLTFLPYSLAQGVYTLLSFLAIIASVLLALKLSTLPKDNRFTILFICLALLSFPTKFTLGMGQSNAIALLLLLSSFYFHQNHKLYLSGLLLGSAIILKTIFIFFLPFLFLRRSPKTLLTAIGVILVSIYTSSIINELNLFQYWYSQVVPPLLNYAGREIYYNQGISGFIARLIPLPDLRQNLTLAISFFFTIPTIWFSLKPKINTTLLTSLSTINLLLVDSLAWQHHHIWLLFPFIALFLYVHKLRHFTAMIAITFAYLLISFNFKQPNNLFYFPQILLLSHVLYGTLCLYLINIWLLFRGNYQHQQQKKIT